MAKIICTRRGSVGLYSLPSKGADGKPDLATIQFFHVPGTSGLGMGGKDATVRGCEIPDDKWKRLKTEDQVTRGLVAHRVLIEVESFDPPADETPPSDAPAWNNPVQGDPEGKPAGKGK